MQKGSPNLLTSAGFNDCNAKLQATALTTIRKAVSLPSDVAFHRSMDHNFAQDLDTFSERVLLVTNKLLNLVATVDQPQGALGKGKGKLASQDDVVDNFHSLVVDSMDQLLERTDTCLDDFLGKNKAPAIAINPPTTSTSGAKNPTQKPSGIKGHLEPVVQHAVHLPKPQLSFKKKPDNSDSPWYPTLTHKYNAKVPLGYIYSDSDADINESFVANHPYHYEITHLEYPLGMFVPCIPDVPTSLEDTQATWVDTIDTFQSMLSKLRNATEIAVDLEHHSYRSYSGFLCLMQISDREEDWIIDLLAVRDEVESLNEVFTNPAIVKVFHGADSDIVWLQQDFNVYIVNLFDTFHASKLLEFPRHGLANLLEMYCDFVPDKRYQLADWRIRPLPEDMLKYARSDTHFLLFIYDNLRNALLDRSQTASQSQSGLQTSSNSPLERGLLQQALARSAETSLRVYAKEPYDALGGSGQSGWDKLAKKWNKVALTAGGPGVGIWAMQREVYRCVHGWREKVAREEDESTKYVLQNHVLFHIADEPPAEMASLLRMFQTSVPAVVKRRAKELLNVIKEAVKRGLDLTKKAGSVQSVGEDQEEKVNEEPRKDVTMLETEMKSLMDESGSTSLWRSRPESRMAFSTSQSSLFGPSKPLRSSASGSTLFATSTSSLFGAVNVALTQNQTSSTGLLSLVSSGDKLHLNELVDKINRSFLIVIPPTVDTPDHPTDDVSSMEMEVEIPFIPPSQRSIEVLNEEQDTIVVVGQARQKRKRPKTSPDGVEATSGSAGEKIKKAKVKNGDETKDEDREAFDFSAVPNILDDNPNLDDGKKKKRREKKEKKGGAFYGDFSAPPKAHSELKSGNQSHTFK